MAGLTYRSAGVDVDAGDELVERIKPLAGRTRIPEMLGGVGGFAGLCGLPAGLEEPVLVSGTDGVGTKLKVAFATNVHDTVGIDLGAMCVNDIVTCGARPLFFLDYFATAKLDIEVAHAVIRGIARGCEDAGCALLGGETAELPGMYAPGEYDLAGFAVGVVDRKRILDGTRVSPGDAVLGVASSGLHSNGYSLARKTLLEHAKLTVDAHVTDLGETVGEAMLRPTRIYARGVRALLDAKLDVRAISHITGGGLPGNVPRVLPEGTGVALDATRWPLPPIFSLIQRLGQVALPEMRRTFNMGLGLVLVVPEREAPAAISALEGAGERAFHIGSVEQVGADVEFEARVRFL
ncbi:MAG: phosphoribosylformylglycinamidine cyclo-ligase [Deltaproteobacteria bacterium]